MNPLSPATHVLERELAQTRLKMVFLRPRMPFPMNAGEKSHSAQLLKQLSREHDVLLVTCRLPHDMDEDAAASAELCKHLITVPFTPRAPGILGKLYKSAPAE